MGYEISVLEKFIGETVKDPYGRVLGTLVALYGEIDGSVSAIEIAKGDNGLETVDIQRVSVEKDGVVVIPTWKAEAMSVAAQLERARKRLKALEDLYSRSEVPRHAYEEFKKKLTAALSDLKTKSREVKGLLRRKIGDLEDEILHVEKALTAMKMSYIAGEISEKSYKAAADALRGSRDRDLEEKSDVKKMLERLIRLEEEPISSTIAKAPEAEAPEATAPVAEQPIVVQVVEE